MPDIIKILPPRQGISASPHVGFGDIHNLDIHSNPGIVSLNNILAKKSTTVVDAQVKWIARDPDTTTNVFALDSNGVLYKSADSGATWAETSDRGGAGQGLIVKWGYVFIFEDTTVDVMKISDSSFTDNWITIGTDSLWHPAIVSKNDGIIYFGCGRYIGSIEEDTTFDPGNAATYTVTLGTSASNALDLPADYRIKCLEELGDDLMIGTWQGTNIYDERIADIFPWDRSSASFNKPIVFAEYGIHAMINVGNSLTVLAGIGGTIYRCDGTNAYIIGQIPEASIGIKGGKYIEYYPGSIMNYKNKVFFGTGNGGTTAMAGQGVYSILQTGRGNVLTMEHTISTLTDGAYTSLKVSALLPITRDTFLVSWDISNTATMTIANPGVVTLANHNFIDGTSVLFSTTSALPTGVTAGTYYFTYSTGDNTFNLYDTKAHALAGGTTGRVTTSGSQSGVHTLKSYGIDLSSATSFAYEVDYSGYFISPFYTIGSALDEVKIGELEYLLSELLRTDEGLKFEYRLNLIDDFTTIETHAYADVNVGAVDAKSIITELPNDIKVAKQIQLKVSLLGTTTTSPEIKSITLK